MAAESRRSEVVALSPEVVRDRVWEIVQKESGFPADEIRDTSLLFEDLGFDSLTVIETGMELEEEFGIEVPEDLMEPVRTVGDLVAAMQQLLLPKP